ncbi:MAG: N-6 DNA methylase [Chloroflexi bacterium B3_Chlor]|nr:MAG: N-6 DNA methylase [Chloroflexi bacterium B3_Chlor]
MSNPDPFRTYLTELRKNLATGAATELTHRSALETLLNQLGDDVQVIHEPSRVECGAPDFIITRGQTPVGYVEAKDIDAKLDAAERSDQLKRYLPSLSNLILTDYLEFRWYVEGEHRETARLAKVTSDGKVKSTKAGIKGVGELLEKFFAQEAPILGRPKDLAQRMASLARMIRDLIEETFKREGEEGKLHGQLMAFRETLIPDLSPAQFADMYAQTITYGLFAARAGDPARPEFTRQQAAWNLPKTNPFLRKLFNEIAGPDLPDPIAWAVDDLAYLLARADMSEVLKDFGKAKRQKDPVVHFYETFLAAYNPKMRQTRGVYYTPEPVVSYIVRSIDHILKTTFDCPLGLADERVMILDPACGTGTFLYFAIQEIYDTVRKTVGKGAWNAYVREKLLPRIFGFELLMAPYAVAHMKLAIQLQELGYDFKGDERLGIYLTNALEEAITKAETLGFARFISEEADAAAEIKKEKPIMVVLGNPPYSVSSANKGAHIERLMDRYKEAVRDERNIQPLSDDYIKFIRFAHDRIERTGYGVVGMITNHAYLSGLIHRGMREQLLKSFSEIYILNLHGSQLLAEKAPDGGPDENVFDIRPGVAISLFVKKLDAEPVASVTYGELWGARQRKYTYLGTNHVRTTDWQTVKPISPYLFFVPHDTKLLSEYQQGWSLTTVFLANSVAVGTYRDHLAVAFDEGELRSRIAMLRDRTVADARARDELGIRDTSNWTLSGAREAVHKDNAWQQRVHRYLYRPFDVRYIFYSADIVARPRPQVMRHMLNWNIGLLAVRRIRTPTPQHLLATTLVADKSAVSLKDNCSMFPLYAHLGPDEAEGGLFPTEEVTREPNLAPEFIAAVADKLVLDFVSDGKGNLENTFGPEDIFHYMYAVFHSPTYRERYAEFLKIDFPRLPLTSDLKLFRALAEKGEELVALHLMESPKLNDLITTFPISDSNEVEKVRYAETSEVSEGLGGLVRGRVYINKTQYFEGVEPDVWEFHIGGYQVLHKWLKDRKGRKLSFDDLLHYQKIVVALKETMRLMEEIDALIPSWPIE